MNSSVLIRNSNPDEHHVHDSDPEQPLYRVRFTYSQGWSVRFGGEGSTESRHFFFAEGECTGRITGRFRGANHPLQRGDGTLQPDFQGIIESTDGAVTYFDYQGYGRTYPAGRRQIVSSATHVSDHEQYRWLNDVVCVSIGEVRARGGSPTELVLDVAELIWQPIPE
ncbi:hypothetical protein BH23GEM5_BH23GEM5_18610 [soil metagenome]